MKIDKLVDDPRPPGCLKLTDRPGWRMRAGNYRVVYEIFDAARQVIILHVGHRKDDYEM